MGKYLKLFNTESYYQSYSMGNSSDFILPNVSYCEDTNNVYISNIVVIIAKYNVTNISQDVKLFDSRFFINNIQNIYIDETKQQTIANTFRFETIGEHIVKIFLKNTISYITKYAFSNCVNLIKIEIFGHLSYLAGNAFEYCHNLVNIVMPENLRSMGGYVFDSCDSLTEIIIPKTIIDIPNGMFNGCTSLRSITLPENIAGIQSEAFSACDNLTSLICLAKNPPYYDNAFDEYHNYFYGGTIYVPASSIEAYKIAEGWNMYSNQIQAIQEQLWENI